MKEHLTPTRRTAVLLADCLMLFLGLYGTVFCLITAFQLPVEYRTITVTCLVCAVFFTAVFALPWRWARGALYPGCAAAVAVTAWRWLELLKLGGLVLARQVVNTWSYEELRRILFDYGEERYAPQIARAIVRRREEGPIETTGELAELIRSAMPPQALREKQHPAKRSFQAIRIAVNGELEALPPMLRSAAEGLRPGGRLAVITFHSLEDRIVKQAMRELATGCTCPPEFPVCVCGKKPKLKLVTRKPTVAGEEELEENPRARSAKLRVAERTEY